MRTEKIYALTLRDQFMYVGRSVNVRDRVHAHRARGIEFDSVAILAEVTTEDSERVEADAIKLLAPLCNKRPGGRGQHSSFVRRANITFFAPLALARQIRRCAREDGRTAAGWIRANLSEYVRQKKAEARRTAA